MLCVILTAPSPYIRSTVAGMHLVDALVLPDLTSLISASVV